MARPKKDLSSLSAKVKESKKPTKIQGEFVCHECGKTKNSNEFYQSYGTSALNVTHICKECIFNSCLDDDDEFDLSRFQGMLRRLDKPFLNQIYITTVTGKCDGSVESIVGNYIKNIHMPQYRGLTFANSDFGKLEEAIKSKNELEEAINASEREKRDKEKIEKASKGNKISAKRREELIDKWGEFDDKTLVRFERKFTQLAKNYEIITTLHLEGLMNYCKYSTLSDINIENDNTSSAKMYGDLAKQARMDARLNPSQLSKADLNTGVASFSEVSQLVAQRDGLIRLPMKYLKKPHDQLDVLLWENVNFNRALFNMPEITYEEMYEYYQQRLRRFNEKYNADLDNGDLGTWLDV